MNYSMHQLDDGDVGDEDDDDHHHHEARNGKREWKRKRREK